MNKEKLNIYEIWGDFLSSLFHTCFKKDNHIYKQWDFKKQEDFTFLYRKKYFY